MLFITHLSFFSLKQEPAQYSSHDNTTLVNSAFPEHNTSPVRKLVEDIVPQGVVAVEPEEASGSDAYLSSEDTAEFEQIRMPLESVLIASQAAQAAELEWDTAGCVLDGESCDRAEIEELVACATEGIAGRLQYCYRGHVDMKTSHILQKRIENFNLISSWNVILHKIKTDWLKKPKLEFFFPILQLGLDFIVKVAAALASSSFNKAASGWVYI